MIRVKDRLIKNFFFLTVAVLFCALVFSVIRSGYFYQFDTDEFFYAQLVYLYAKGYRPFLDIYNSFYTPMFELVIAPAFWLKGFTFAALYFTRAIMIVLFAVRIVAAYILIKTLWNKRTALLFLPLFLFDPFTVFSAMQIRPDNLMMTVYTISLVTLTRGLTKKSVHAVLFSAFLFGFTVIIFAKILPSIAVLLFLFSAWTLKERKTNLIPLYVMFFLLPVALFALWGQWQGALVQIIQQMILDAREAYSVFRLPVPFGSFYKPENAYIYGVMGKPLTWVYVWILPLLGAAGWFATVHRALTKRFDAGRLMMQVTLVLSFVFQFASLFFLPVVFMQHYLPINWLYALFAAVAIDTILTDLDTHAAIQLPVVAGLFIAFLCLTKTSIETNLARATIIGAGRIEYYENRWKQIPQNENVFPNFLFRPLIFPVPYGYYIGNIPLSIFARLPSIPNTLEIYHVQRLLLDDYTIGNLPYEAQTYIRAHYTRVSGDDELMERSSVR